jgi:ribosomal protein L4
MIIDVHDKQGKVVEQVELDDSVWTIEPNIPVMHQALLRQLANARLGTRDTKTRGGSGAAGPSRGARKEPGAPARVRFARRSGSAVVSFGGHISGRSTKTCHARCAAWRFARLSRQKCAMSD